MRLSINFHHWRARGVLAILAATLSFAAQAYDLRIANRTEFVAGGEVVYVMCRPDRFVVQPGQTWSTNGRGACLIRAINGMFAPTPFKTAPALTNYSSSGTAYADFIIASVGSSARIWSANELASHNRANAPAPVAPTAPTGPTVTWSPVAADTIPPKTAFIGGRQRFGGKNDAQGQAVYDVLPVCRGEFNGAVAIGNATPWWSHAVGWTWDKLRCLVNVGGGERELPAYEVLIVDPQVVIRNPNAVRWTAAANGALPPSPYNAAKSGNPIYVCRAQTPETEGAVRVGVMAENGCYVSYGGHNRYAANYDVLVVEGSASAQLARGIHEPRLAINPERPARVSQAGEDCSRPSGRCAARLAEMRAMGAYKINGFVLGMAAGSTTYYRKLQGNTWEVRAQLGTNQNGSMSENVRQLLEVERTDDQISLFGDGKTTVFALNNADVKMGRADTNVTAGYAHFLSEPQLNMATGRWPTRKRPRRSPSSR